MGSNQKKSAPWGGVWKSFARKPLVSIASLYFPPQGAGNYTQIIIKKAFPSVPYSKNKHINVKGNKSPYDGDLVYWSERNSKLYDDITSKVLKRQNHSCDSCGLKFIGEEKVHLHHTDGNHGNWKIKNLVAVHQSCHQYSHMSKG